MRTVGFVISNKENEFRRAILPKHIKNIKNRNYLYFEEGYGKALGIDDECYKELGCNVVSRDEALKKDIICDPKIGDSNYIKELKKGQSIFGWVHAVQNREITDILVNNKLTAFAWEDMFESGRHSFWRNNEIAGEAAIIHAFQCHGIMPYNTKVAILGNGNTARGAYRILTSLGADVTVYNKRTEKLLNEEIGMYDVIVNGILWDTNRTDHIIYEKDLKRMKKNSMIIDISCDRNGGVESSIPTTIENPTYEVDGIRHYVVDHTPSIFYKSVTDSISEVTSKYIDMLIEGELNNTLQACIVIEDGEIINQDIIKFQSR